jgi:hypothetical protein
VLAGNLLNLALGACAAACASALLRFRYTDYLTGDTVGFLLITVARLVDR